MADIVVYLSALTSNAKQAAAAIEALSSAYADAPGDVKEAAKGGRAYSSGITGPGGPNAITITGKRASLLTPQSLVTELERARGAKKP